MVAKTTGASHIARVRKGTMEDALGGKNKGKPLVPHSGGSSPVLDEDDMPLVKPGRVHKKMKNIESHRGSSSTHVEMKPASPLSSSDHDTAAEEPQPPLVVIAPATPGAVAMKEMAAKRGKPDAPKFLIMLYEILQNESDKVIRWTDDGLALQILEQTNVTEQVLPKYFNHTNFHSFQRQLNYFGFRKWTKSKTDICTFSHPYFRRNQPELMHLIKRKKATRRANGPEQADASTSTPEPHPAMAAGATTKKLLPLSPSGKRRLPYDDDEQQHQASNSNQHSMSFPSSIGHGSMNSGSNTITLAPLNASNHSALASRPFTTPPSAPPNAISPASGGAKKKAKTTNDNKLFHAAPPNESQTSPSNGHPEMNELTAIAAMNPQSFGKGTLPNLDIVRNRLIYRHPTQGNNASAGSAPMQGFPGGFGFNPPNGQAQSSSTPTTENAALPPQSPATPSDSNAMFSNSFSDPVDILLRIKKSRAMSQDNTQLQSPQQRVHNQVEGIASLQNFLLTQSLYTNRLESQLKLALEENEALRHLVETKAREVEALRNERKMIQNENSVLTEDKNKLFEINRDLLSKLFPQ